MMWLPEGAKFKINLLQKDLDRISAEMLVFRMGKEEEERSLDLHLKWIEALESAVENIKSSPGIAVSLKEYRNIHIDLALANKKYQEKKLIILNIGNALMSKEKEAKIIKNAMERILIEQTKGKVLNFKS